MRYLLLDKIIDIELGKKATGIKTISISEDFLEHHFPRYPIMPGVLIVEALVQLSNWLVSASTEFRQKVLLECIDSAKFRQFARPGDTLILEVTLKKLEEEKAYFQGVAKIDGKIATTTSFSMKIVLLETLENQNDARYLFQNTLYDKENDSYRRNIKNS